MSAGADADYTPSDDLMTPGQSLINTALTDPWEATEEELSEANELTQAIIDRIDRVPKPDRSRTETRDGRKKIPLGPNGEFLDLPGKKLPGFGETREDCGDDLALFCDCCGSTTLSNRTCKQSMCPRCAPTWIRERALSRCARLDAVRRVLESNRDEHQRYHHAAFSPPDDWYTRDPDTLERTFDLINDILTEMGLEGVVFYHPYRIGDDDGLEGDDRGRWKDLLFSGKDWKDVKGKLTLDPHFHVVALGHNVPGGELTKKVHEETGWIFERITKGEDSKVSIYNDQDLARVVTYCLSHTGIDTSGERNQVQMRTFGTCMNNGGSIDIQVLPEKKRRMDVIVRKNVPTTLGVDMSSQLCTEHTLDVPDVNNAPENTGPSMQSIAISGGSSGAERSDSGGSGPLDLGGRDGELPDVAGLDGVTKEQVEKFGRSECDGRMLHIKQADEYLEDDEWRDQAENVDDLQTTWDDWRPRLDELTGA